MKTAKDTNKLEMEGCQLAYSRSGAGKKHLLVFHGFGQSKEAMEPLLFPLRNEYTLWCFDLFFHGQSVWPEAHKHLSKAFWKKLMSQFFSDQKISEASLLGYSMGGKFVLATLESFPKSIEKLYLLAPDGVRVNFWYSLATWPLGARQAFKFLAFKPPLFFAFVKNLNRLGLISDSLRKFTEGQLKTGEDIQRVYHSWVVFQQLAFNVDELILTINDQKIEVELYLGKYDQVIREAHFEHFISKLENVNQVVFKTGHNNLINHVAKHLHEATQSA